MRLQHSRPGDTIREVPASVVHRLLLGLSFIVALLLGPSGQASPAPMVGPVRTIVVFGDSQAQGVAGALQRMLMRDRGFRVIDKTVPGTALSQKLQFDWVSTIEQYAAAEHPDVAVMMFGGNDRLAVRLEAGGHAIGYKTAAWKQMYAERMNTVLAALADAHVPVIWLGQPVAREADYAQDMAYLNGIFSEIIPTTGCAWMPLWDVVTDETGGYTAYGKGLDGETKRLRQDDGVHFTPAGYDIIAHKVKARIDTVLPPPAATTVAAHS
jgi:hypothetical protein